jgi:hypothetical protein
MSLSRLEQVLSLVTAALVFLVVLWLGRAYGARRVSRWCEEQGYELIDWRGAKFFEGPRAWLRTENEDAYYIEVRDRQGLTRSGYLVFGSYWWPWPFVRKARVRWD